MLGKIEFSHRLSESVYSGVAPIASPQEAEHHAQHPAHADAALMFDKP
jgi:hypothetical protein